MVATRRAGIGTQIFWDATGGTTFTELADVIDGGKIESKANTVKVGLMSSGTEEYIKTVVDGGQLSISLVYDEDDATYQSLVDAFKLTNCPPPSWRIVFQAECGGSGSGLTPAEFHAHIVGLSREIKKESFMSAEIMLQVTGDPFSLD